MGRRGKRRSNKKKTVNFDKTEEKYNNNMLLVDLRVWEKEYLKLLPWSYVEEGVYPKVQGHLNLLEPLKCEETLVRMDQHDVKAVLKIMGHHWPAGQKKSRNKKEKNWGTKALEELVVSVGREEDELVSWWGRPYCMENVRKHLKKDPTTTMQQPLFFDTYDEEQRLWGFVERMESAMFKANLKVGTRKSARTNKMGKPGKKKRLQ